MSFLINFGDAYSSSSIILTSTVLGRNESYEIEYRSDSQIRVWKKTRETFQLHQTLPFPLRGFKTAKLEGNQLVVLSTQNHPFPNLYLSVFRDLEDLDDSSVFCSDDFDIEKPFFIYKNLVCYLTLDGNTKIATLNDFTCIHEIFQREFPLEHMEEYCRLFIDNKERGL